MPVDTTIDGECDCDVENKFEWNNDFKGCGCVSSYFDYYATLNCLDCPPLPQAGYITDDIVDFECSCK